MATNNSPFKQEELPAPPLDQLHDYHASLQELGALAVELLELSAKRQTLHEELCGLVAASEKLAEQCVSADTSQELQDEIQGQLESLARHEDGLRPQIAALERKFFASATALQQRLDKNFDGWLRLREAIVSQVALDEQKRFVGMLSPGKRLDPRLIELCAELGQNTDAYLDTFALKLPPRSFAWQRVIADVPADSWQPGLKRDEIVDHLLEVAGQFSRVAQQLLSQSAALSAIPPFKLPETPVKPLVDANQPLDTRRLSEKLLEASGKRREDLTEMDLKILRDSEESDRSYLKQRSPWAVAETPGATSP